MSCFSIDNVPGTLGTFGFVPGSVDTTKISDGLMECGNALNKMGTSIPTPYARIYLFASAFQQVNEIESRAPQCGHWGAWDEKTQKYLPTPYHYLVSECLDMFEFVFKYGKSPAFEVIDWNRANECSVLKGDASTNHRVLGEALDTVVTGTVLANVPSIYMFTWKGHIVGGTSPISLVYTSPNLEKDLKDENLTGVGGQPLFDKKQAIPLSDRAESFRRFMYTYMMLDLAPIAGTCCADLFKYLLDSRDSYDSDLKKKYNLQANPQHQDELPFVTETGIFVNTAGVPLYVSENQVVLGDYIMQPTSNLYTTEILNGANRTVRTPMALTNRGLGPGIPYVDGRDWINGKDKIPAILDSALSRRLLPGTMAEYPFVTVDDFLEDKIIEVSYHLRNTAFYTGSDGNITHLLPLKKDFFKYFKLEDLYDENGSYSQLVQMVEDDEAETVTVTLNIPLVNGRIIPFQREYGKEDIIDCYEASHTFDLAVFPFYRLQTTPNVDNNLYDVMLGSSVCNTVCRFFKIDQLISGETMAVQDFIRVNVPEIQTRHYRVDGAFDLIELEVQGTKGLLIPIFRKIDTALATQQYTFCVDFGTTNTHVAYAKIPLAHPKPISLTDIESLDIDPSIDRQVITLHDDDGVVEFVKFTTFLNREFVPIALGGKCKLSYPLRTVSCEVNTQVQKFNMFGNTNIGFNYSEELMADNLQGSTYQTNLKWDRTNGGVLAESRLTEYFKELLWILKNKSVLNGGTENFTVIATYPQSMRDRELDTFKDAWERAKEYVRSQVYLQYKFESITPYYSFLAQNNYGSIYVNFDIGGGTTDILYNNQDSGESIALSALFAANDLWGDGVVSTTARNQNGFITYYLQTEEFQYMSEANQQKLKSVIDHSTSSADIISYLFSNDEETRFSSAIKNSPELMQLLITHFSSLIYYLAYVLDLGEYDTPEQVTFTGMGSKYIKLISGNSATIASLVNTILAYYGSITNNDDLKNAHVQVSFADNPKIVTAQGGLIINGFGHRAILPATDTFYYGFDNEQFGETVRYDDLAAKRNSVVSFFSTFVNLFRNQEFLDVLSNQLDNFVQENYVKALEVGALRNFNLLQNDIDPMLLQMRSKLREPLFFWPLKNALYELGKRMVTKK